MAKLLTCLLFFTLVSFSAHASGKAVEVLKEHGFKQAEIESALEQFPELEDTIIVAETQKFIEDRFALKLYPEADGLVYIITRNFKNVVVEKSEALLEMETKIISGDIKNTLYETIERDTNSEDLARQMADGFKEDFSTTKGLRANASYEFEVAQYFDEGRFVKYGSILKASLVIGKATTRKILKLDSETYTWSLQPEDSTLADKPFYAPIRSSRVSSLFQLNRRHPVTRRHQPHNGVDFVAKSGTPIFPALDGEVITIARTRSKGKFITILHDNGYETTYIHLKKFQKGLRVGMRVELEDQIGEVGRTGYSTGAHLHFGVIKDGYYVNPLYLLKDYGYDEKDLYEGAALNEQPIIEGEEQEADTEYQ